MARSLGRNDLCPKCGKKIKHCLGHRSTRSWRMSGLLAVLVFAVAAAALYDGAARAWNAWRMSDLEQLRAAMDSHIKSKPLDSWWMLAPPLATTPGEVHWAIRRTEDVRLRILGDMERYRSLSPLADEIYREFSKLRVTYFKDGLSTFLALSTDSPPIQERMLEVCFVPRDQAVRYAFPSSCYYRQDWRALMLAAVRYPDIVFSGLVMHELGHALRHQQGVPSAVAPQQSESYILEEIEMHKLENAVYNAETDGRYYGRVDRIIARESDARDFRDAVLGITQQDLVELDDVLGAHSAGQAVSNSLTMEHVFSVGLRHIELRVPPDEQLAQKVALYRWTGDTLVR